MKTISVAIHNFKIMNLDALFVCTNAPKRSAFNRVERRMAPLSRELAGLILPHDHYGTHLDEQGRTIDAELEKSNFRYAGETLAAVWNGMVIDQHPVIAEFIEPDQSELHPAELTSYDEVWLKDHVRTSQYCLHIVKCDNSECCLPWRSSFRTIIPQRFLPAPLPVAQTINGIKAPERNNQSNITATTWDFFRG